MSIIELLDKPVVSRACYTWRYSSSRLCDPENLSTHVYEVEMIGLILINEIYRINSTEEVDREKFLMKALLHDVDETILGDTPRPLKYASNGIHKEINQVADAIANEIISDTFYHINIRDKLYTDYFMTSKSGKEGILVKIADMLTVVKKVRLEVEYLHNLTMLNVYDNLVDYINLLDTSSTYSQFDTPEVRSYLRDMFEDLRDYVNSVREKYKDVTRL